MNGVGVGGVGMNPTNPAILQLERVEELLRENNIEGMELQI